MLNVSKDTNYIYDNTMKSVIYDSDIITSATLLICAIFCASILPLIRDVLMAFILYLSIFAVLHAIFSDGETKMRIAFGTII